MCKNGKLKIIEKKKLILQSYCSFTFFICMKNYIKLYFNKKKTTVTSFFQITQKKLFSYKYDNCILCSDDRNFPCIIMTVYLMLVWYYYFIVCVIFVSYLCPVIFVLYLFTVICLKCLHNSLSIF